MTPVSWVTLAICDVSDVCNASVTWLTCLMVLRLYCPCDECDVYDACIGYVTFVVFIPYLPLVTYLTV